MIHAGIELLEAIRGEAPEVCAAVKRPAPACASVRDGEGTTHAFGWHGGPSEPRAFIDCPACLQLIREATDPVRWDALEERGLAPKLEAK